HLRRGDPEIGHRHPQPDYLIHQAAKARKKEEAKEENHRTPGPRFGPGPMLIRSAARRTILTLAGALLRVCCLEALLHMNFRQWNLPRISRDLRLMVAANPHQGCFSRKRSRILAMDGSGWMRCTA